MTTTPTTRPPSPVAAGLDLLGGSDDAPAIVTADGVLTYAELRERVRRRRDQLGTARRLVLLEMANDLRSVVSYLACLQAGHPVVLVPPHDLERQREVVERYRPDLVVTDTGDRHDPTGAATGDIAGESDLHPDLALLLSTSGSTGSPRLVRLSRTNLLANAHSIVELLGVRATDRALTSLPLHYCYGLSVLHSHLLAGAAVVLSELSVADECFWDLAVSARATTFAAVPYTFDLLDSTGFVERDLPHLRYVTQAGGRLAPDVVRRYAELGQRRGWDLRVMYGQTEATARMAYLPAALTIERPDAVGVPVPGGSFRLAPVPGIDLPHGVGELVYAGPNVMMGYALDRADLSRGHELDELHTGDLARRGTDGLWEITGRLRRSAKVFGLRLDLDRVEEQARQVAGSGLRVVAHDETLHAFVTRRRHDDAVRAAVAAAASVPAGAVRVHVVDELPSTASGKPGYASLEQHARLVAPSAQATSGEDPSSPEALRLVYAVALGRPDATLDDTFVGLGGDSLSFVEVSTQLGDRLGRLPRDWPQRTVAELAALAVPATDARPSLARRARGSLRPIETGVALRALAILLVVVTHTDLVIVMGGAHVLLAAAGFQLARLTLRTPGRRPRRRRLLGALAAVAAPASLWIAGCAVVTGDYSPATVLYLNGFVGDRVWSADWQFWFLEVVLWSYLALALVLSVPVLDRWQRRWPFAAAMTAVAIALAVRYATVGTTAELTEKYTLVGAVWLLALGWAAAECRTWPQRLLVALVLMAGLDGYYLDQLDRTRIVGVGVLVLLLVPWVPLPRPAARVLAAVAGASLWIYLTHWQVYPGLEAAGHPWLAVAASVGVGIACHHGCPRLTAKVRAQWRIGVPSRRQ